MQYGRPPNRQLECFQRHADVLKQVWVWLCSVEKGAPHIVAAWCFKHAMFKASVGVALLSWWNPLSRHRIYGREGQARFQTNLTFFEAPSFE